jgi:hypothetical protein
MGDAQEDLTHFLDTSMPTQVQNWLHVWKPFIISIINLAKDLLLQGMNTVQYSNRSLHDHTAQHAPKYENNMRYLSPPTDSNPSGLSLVLRPICNPLVRLLSTRATQTLPLSVVLCTTPTWQFGCLQTTRKPAAA